MLEKIQKYWKEGTFIGGVVVFVILAWDVKDRVVAAEKINQTQDQTLEKVAQIAQSLQDPYKWLRDYLVNHNIDSSSARDWAYLSKGPVVDSLQVPKNNIVFLQKEPLPELGVQCMYIKDKLITLDTLWDFRKK